MQSILKEKKLLPEIQNWVYSVSQAFHKGSLVFNVFLLHCLKNDIPLPDLCDRKLYEHCILIGESSPPTINDDLKYVWQTYFKNFPRNPQLYRSHQAYNLAAGTYKTNFLNSLVTPFRGRQWKFIQAICKKCNVHRSWVYHIVRSINESTYQVELPQEVRDFVTSERAILGNPGFVDKNWLKLHKVEVLKYYYHILKISEHHFNIKKFTLAPVCRIRSHSMTIDTDTLFGIVKNVFEEDIEAKNKGEFREKQDEYWKKYFDFSKLLPKRKFTGTIRTDGVSASIHFRVPKKEQTDSNSNSNPIKELSKPTAPSRVIAIDPGRVNLIFGVERLPEGNLKTYKLTRKTYYNQSGMKKAKERSARWEKMIDQEEKIFRKISLKTTQISKWVQFVRNYLRVYSVLWKEKTRKKWGQQRFRVFCLRKRTLDTFFNTMKSRTGEKPVIAYGAAKFKSTGTGEVAAPTTSLYKKCSDLFTTIPVDEHRTTRICHDCDAPLLKVTKDKWILRGRVKNMLEWRAGELAKWNLGMMKLDREVRGLRWCGSTKCRTFKNRDLNAALNILRCFTSEERPENLSHKCPALGDYKSLRLTR